MPSSTFSSEDLATGRAWGRVWLSALLMCGMVLGGLEVFVRRAGFRPSVRDDFRRWSTMRERCVLDPHAVTLLGSSRMHLAVDPEEFRTDTRRSVFQLAIGNASTPLPVLEDLAADDRFRGTVLCEVHPLIFFDESGEREAWTREWIEAPRHTSVAERIENRMRDVLRARMALRSPELSLASVARKLGKTGRFPEPTRLLTDPERFQSVDYRGAKDLELTRADALRWYETHCRVAASEAGLAAIAERAHTAVRRIEARGGAVVFVRLPSTGPLRAVEDRRAPRVSTWDRLLAQRPLRGLHCDDVAALGHFDCPDGSHLDRQDRAAFTRAWVKALLDRGLLAPADG